MKIAILGCENSHADAFLELSLNDEKYKDVEIIGIYSEEKDSYDRLKEKGFNGICAESPTDFLGMVDGIMVTARHGDNHYKYALPYIKKGIPAFIDKPFCVDLNLGKELIRIAKENKTNLCGGSSIRFLNEWDGMKEFIAENEIVAASVAAPINMVNEYGGYYFYSQHLIDTMIEFFGENAKSVRAFCPDTTKNRVTAMFDYGDLDVVAHFSKTYAYTITLWSVENGVKSAWTYNGAGAYEKELSEFCEMVKSGKMPCTYERLLKPLEYLHAIEKSFTEDKPVEL